jgi:GH18 family chitinase
VLNQSLMDQLATTVVGYLLANQLDGFDIDWEFPQSLSDRAGLAALLKVRSLLLQI